MSATLKSFASRVRAMPVIGPAAAVAKNLISKGAFDGSRKYWEKRYASGGDSGAGSYGRLNAFKAETINGLIREYGLKSAVEFGCGDGAQLAALEFATYTGIDVSKTVVSRLRENYSADNRFTFLELHEADGIGPFDAAMSLDVIYHLVEDEVFDAHMKALFAAASALVIIYASNRDEQPADKHVRHRQFSHWVERNAPDWHLVRHIANPYPFDWKDPRNTSFADFFVYARNDDGASDVG